MTALAAPQTVGVARPSRQGVSSGERAHRVRHLLRRRPADGSLASLAVGSAAVITGLSEELPPATARRLLDLGFVPGADIEVLRRAPMADPVVYRVADTEIALRRVQAREVLVAPAVRA